MAAWIETSHVLNVPTRGKGFVDFTRPVAEWLDGLGAQGGLLTVFVRHTSASLTIQENADPNVRVDLLDALERLAPEDRHYAHHEEGPDDMPSHIKSMLTSTACRSRSRRCNELSAPGRGSISSNIAPRRICVRLFWYIGPRGGA